MMLLLLRRTTDRELLVLSRLLGSDSAACLSEAPVEKGAKSTEQETLRLFTAKARLWQDLLEYRTVHTNECSYGLFELFDDYWICSFSILRRPRRPRNFTPQSSTHPEAEYCCFSEARYKRSVLQQPANAQAGIESPCVS